MPDLIPATINLSEQRKCIEQADGFSLLFCDYFWKCLNVLKRDEIIRKDTLERIIINLAERELL